MKKLVLSFFLVMFSILLCDTLDDPLDEHAFIRNHKNSKIFFEHKVMCDCKNPCNLAVFEEWGKAILFIGAYLSDDLKKKYSFCRVVEEIDRDESLKNELLAHELDEDEIFQWEKEFDHFLKKKKKYKNEHDGLIDFIPWRVAKCLQVKEQDLDAKLVDKVKRDEVPRKKFCNCLMLSIRTIQYAYGRHKDAWYKENA